MPDAIISDFKYHPYGMAMLPYYTIRRLSDEEFEVGISNDEFSWEALEVEKSPFDTFYLDAPEDPFENINTSRVVVGKEAIEEFSEKVVDAGLIEIDGFAKHRDLGPHVLDGGDGFALVAVLSDGRAVTSTSTNTYPKHYQEVASEIYRFFDEHSDFSRRYPTSIPDSTFRRIEIKCGGVMEELSWSPYVRIEINRGWKQWAVTLKDKRGDYLGEVTDISDYGNVEDPDELPFDDLMGFIEELGVIEHNPTSSSVGDSIEYIAIYASFENGQELSYTTRELPEGYDDFKRKLADFVLDYYRKMKGE